MGGRPQVSSGFSSNMNRSNFQRSRQQDSDDEEGKYFFCSLNLSWWACIQLQKKWACKAWTSAEPLGPWTFAITTNSILNLISILFGNCQAFLLRMAFMIYVFYRCIFDDFCLQKKPHSKKRVWMLRILTNVWKIEQNCQ